MRSAPRSAVSNSSTSRSPSTASNSKKPSRSRIRCRASPAHNLGRVIDSHTHLFLCEKPTVELLEAAAAAGVNRMLNVGLDETTNAQVIAQAEQNEAVFASVGRHPNDAGGFDDEA